MGNRAVITTNEKQIGIYTHWNGGRDSVSGFLAYCRMTGEPSPEVDDYGWSALVTVMHNFLGDHVAVDLYTRLDTDNFDNGVYIIENWTIVGREFFNGEEQDEYGLFPMMMSIDKVQPHPLGERKIREFVTKYGGDYIIPQVKE